MSVIRNVPSHPVPVNPSREAPPPFSQNGTSPAVELSVHGMTQNVALHGASFPQHVSGRRPRSCERPGSLGPNCAVVPADGLLHSRLLTAPGNPSGSGGTRPDRAVLVLSSNPTMFGGRGSLGHLSHVALMRNRASPGSSPLSGSLDSKTLADGRPSDGPARTTERLCDSSHFRRFVLMWEPLRSIRCRRLADLFLPCLPFRSTPYTHRLQHFRLPFLSHT